MKKLFLATGFISIFSNFNYSATASELFASLRSTTPFITGPIASQLADQIREGEQMLVYLSECIRENNEQTFLDTITKLKQIYSPEDFQKILNSRLPNERNCTKTLLHVAVEGLGKHSLEFLKILINHGANPNVYPNSDLPLRIALDTHGLNLQAAIRLIEAGAQITDEKIDTFNDQQQALLRMAALNYLRRGVLTNKNG